MLYQSLKMIYWSNLEQKGSVFPNQETRLVLASLIFIHTAGGLGDIYIALHGCLTFPSQIAEPHPSQLWHWLFQPQPHVLLRPKIKDDFIFYIFFPELDMEAGTEFMIFKDESRQVTCSLLKNLFTATRPSANTPSSQQHQWVGSKTIENPITRKWQGRFLSM